MLLMDDIFVIKDQENSVADPNMSTAENWDIDLINFKVFALLRGPGRPKDKANVLFDLIYGPKKQKSENPDEDTITW